MSKDKMFHLPHLSTIAAFLSSLLLIKHLQSVFICDCQLSSPHHCHVGEVNLLPSERHKLSTE